MDDQPGAMAIDAGPAERRGRGLRALRLGLLALSCGFVAYLLRDVDLSPLGRASLVEVAAAAVLVFVALAGMAGLWIVLVRHLGGGGRRRAVPLLRAFARSWLARYLPGSAWALGARLVYTDGAAVSPRALAVSLADELILVVLGSAALGAGLLAVDYAGVVAGGMALAGAIGAAALAGCRLDALARFVLRVLHGRLVARTGVVSRLREAAETPPLRLGLAGALVSGYALVCACGGLAFALLAASIGPMPIGELARFVGGFSIAVVAGIAVLVVPAGLGVREAVLVSLLRPVVGTAVVAWAAVSYRVLAILVDVCFFLLVEALAASHRPAKGEHEGGQDRRQRT